MKLGVGSTVKKQKTVFDGTGGWVGTRAGLNVV